MDVKKHKSDYIYTTVIKNNEFKLEITITEKNNFPKVKVFDTETNEEYSVIHSPLASGKFVGSVIEECENDNVWIGGSVTILAGVKIGNNAIIGAGSVVTRDIPDNVVVVGNPCKVLKSINQ